MSRIDAIKMGESRMPGLGAMDPNKKIKKEELAGQLSGNPNYVAYMPNLGDLLNGKGTAQAATQV